MTALTKADIAEKLTKELGVSKREGKDFVEEFYETIRAGLANGDYVKLSGFGCLLPRDKNARPGRNPKTGVEVTIESRRVVIFRAGQKLKARVENESANQETGTDTSAGGWGASE